MERPLRHDVIQPLQTMPISAADLSHYLAARRHGFPEQVCSRLGTASGIASTIDRLESRGVETILVCGGGAGRIQGEVGAVLGLLESGAIGGDVPYGVVGTSAGSAVAGILNFAPDPQSFDEATEEIQHYKGVSPWWEELTSSHGLPWGARRLDMSSYFHRNVLPHRGTIDHAHSPVATFMTTTQMRGLSPFLFHNKNWTRDQEEIDGNAMIQCIAHSASPFPLIAPSRHPTLGRMMDGGIIQDLKCPTEIGRSLLQNRGSGIVIAIDLSLDKPTGIEYHDPDENGVCGITIVPFSGSRIDRMRQSLVFDPRRHAAGYRLGLQAGRWIREYYHERSVVG